MNRLFCLLIALLILSCQNHDKYVSSYNETNIEWNKSEKIKVLNFGTFHFGYTPDKNKTEFDENNQNNQKQAHEIAQLLSEFKPTVIIVETVPSYNLELQEIFKQYKTNPTMEFNNINEIQLIAFEVGRLSESKRIYGIDHQLGYNYMIGDEIKNNDIDSVTYNYFKSSAETYNQIENMSLKNALTLMNTNDYLNWNINVNADILTYVGKNNGHQGADEASEFYKRNLRMFSNLNRIPLSEDDRVFILMGAGHTAFFRDFISRSPKYEGVPVEHYLK
ncbi:DUF5694 domain-containing protein [Weeksellaceae bacterium KMM 9713]|uniref:DUF5694 domain-containing protein n=1 Tax=Profundicola chukchiensis TaxID=2961959 RepID=A0A9X4MW73_9FLAO|nr:DUF5694 domain-containing protein [Profundicola chukchiensis]MDG4945998.1 DUF5694 domain-containing protein [Profundicola chukchiensis]